LSGWPTECRYCRYPAPMGRCHGNYFWLYMRCTLAPPRHLANTTEPSMCGGDAALCQITLTTCSRWWPLPSWIFLNFKCLTVGRVSHKRRIASLCQILSKSVERGRDIAIFRFSRWRPPVSWIFQRSRGTNCVTVSNVVQIG